MWGELSTISFCRCFMFWSVSEIWWNHTVIYFNIDCCSFEGFKAPDVRFEQTFAPHGATSPSTLPSHVNQSHRLSLVTLKKSGFYMPSTLNTAESLHRFRVEMSKAKCTTQESSAVDQKGIFLVTITQDNNGAVTSDSRCWAADMAPLFQPWQLKRCTKIHNGCILKGHSL